MRGGVSKVCEDESMDTELGLAHVAVVEVDHRLIEAYRKRQQHIEPHGKQVPVWIRYKTLLIVG